MDYLKEFLLYYRAARRDEWLVPWPNATRREAAKMAFKLVWIWIRLDLPHRHRVCSNPCIPTSEGEPSDLP